MTENSNSSGSKAFAGVIVVVALITGVGAIVRPMQQQINSLEQQVLREQRQLDARHTSHVLLDAHPGALAMHAKTMERFSEVETQFAGLREVVGIRQMIDEKRLDEIDRWHLEHEIRVVGIDASQWERIKALERAVYGGEGD